MPCKKFSSFLFLALLKEWTTLTDYLGGLTVAGTVIKKDDAKWTSNTGTNTSVFSGLPSGFEFLVVSPILEAALSSGVLPGTTPALHGTAACPAAMASWAVTSQTSPLGYPSVA